MSTLLSRILKGQNLPSTAQSDHRTSRMRVEALSDHEWLVHDAECATGIDLVGFIELSDLGYEALLLDEGTSSYFRTLPAAIDYFEIYFHALPQPGPAS